MPSVQFDLDQIDHLLSTTRAVRRRLDLERPVPDDVLLRCIDLAEQAPTGGNQTYRRWLVIRDPETKRRLADLYREVGLPFLQSLATRAQAEEGKRDRVFGSALYLAENLERVPALVMVTIRGKHDGSGRPGLYDSVLQSAWSFCLAARARGLGTAWTTLHLNRAAEVAELLAIPEDFTQVVLFPVAWTDGGDFRPAPRRPASEITYFDQWGLTRGHPSPDGTPRIDGCGVTVDVPIGVAPERVWDLIVDRGVGSDVTSGVAWAGADPPGSPGSAGLTGWDPPRFLGWCAPEAGAPDIQWGLTIEPILLPGNPPEDGSLLVYSATLGAGSAEDSQAGFQRALRDRMQLTVAQIRTVAEDMRPDRG